MDRLDKATIISINFLPVISSFPVDYLAQVFDTLKSDLKDERSKELFLTYQATQVIIPHMKATHRALVGSAVDICLQMSMESSKSMPVYFVQLRSLIMEMKLLYC